MHGFCVFQGDDANELFVKLALHSLEKCDVENDSENAIGPHDETSCAFVGWAFWDVDTQRAGTSFFPRLVWGHSV